MVREVRTVFGVETDGTRLRKAFCATGSTAGRLAANRNLPTSKKLTLLKGELLEHVDSVSYRRRDQQLSRSQFS